jgi:DNA-binding protein H-NS
MSHSAEQPITNVERRARIEALRQGLKGDLFELERKFRADSAELEKKCREAIAGIEREIREHSAAELREVREQINAILEKRGLSAADVLPALAKPRKPVKAAGDHKYTGPNGEVWSGRGRAPNWYKRQLEAQQGTSVGEMPSTSDVQRAAA